MKIADLKRDIDERFEQVNERFEQVNVRFESVDARFDRLETAVVTGLETTRRHMDVLIEQLRADARLWLEGFDLRQQQIDALLSSNTHEHAAFVEMLRDHEVRIKTLERPSRAPKTPRSR